MLKAIKVVCRQNLVNYRKPTAFTIGESYKLPAYSTVIGMVHNACGISGGEYIPMKVSVQGNYKSVVSDMYTRIFVSSYDKSKSDIYCSIIKNKDEKPIFGITRSPSYNELLTDVNLILHIIPECEKDFERVFNGLKFPQNYLSIGRHEDLINVDNIQIVNLEEKTNEILNLNYNAYIPDYIYKTINQIHSEEIGTFYTINKQFKIIDIKGVKYRKWLSLNEGGKILVKYILKGSTIKGNFLIEENGGMGVFPA